jgi:hypothetical protein
MDNPNVLWMGGAVVVPTAKNSNEIVFAKPPILKLKERQEPFKRVTDYETRIKTESGSFNLTLRSRPAPYIFSDDLKFATRISENSKNVILDSKRDNTTSVSNQTLVPQYTDLTRISNATPIFTKDFEGGELIFRDLTNLLGKGITVPDFSCSIVEVIDSKTVEIYPSFQFVYTENNEKRIFNSFRNATSVTASYFTKDVNLTTVDTESYVQIEIEDLEPLAGTIESVHLSYKPYGSFGEDIHVGDFDLNPQEFLIDTTATSADKFQVKEKAIGTFESLSDFNFYWDIVAGKFDVFVSESVVFLNEGIQINSDDMSKVPGFTSSADLTRQYDYFLKPKSQYPVSARENTEYTL